MTKLINLHKNMKNLLDKTINTMVLLFRCICNIWVKSGSFLYGIGLMSRVFANGPGDQGSIPGQVIPETQKMVLDAALLNTQHYKVRIKG